MVLCRLGRARTRPSVVAHRSSVVVVLLASLIGYSYVAEQRIERSQLLLDPYSRKIVEFLEQRCNEFLRSREVKRR